MAGTALKKTNKPVREWGDKSTSVEGKALYYEYGTITLANGDTSTSVPTDLSNIEFFIFSPKDAAFYTANPYTTAVISSGAITVTNTDPTAACVFEYKLVGSVVSQ